MLTSGQINRNDAIAKTIEHNPATTEMVLKALEIFRKCRARIPSRRDEKFTIEDILRQVEISWSQRRKIPHQLNGAIANSAVKRNIIKRSGEYTKASRDSRHANEVPTWCWVTDGIEVLNIPKSSHEQI